MGELNAMKQKSIEDRAQEMSPFERAEIKQLSNLIQGTDVIELVRKANQIIEAQDSKEKTALIDNHPVAQEMQEEG